MNIPEPWIFALLALAAFRVWKLLAEDTILDRPRAWLIRSEKASEFLSCMWCAGGWCALLTWLAWLAWPHGVAVAAVPFALSAAVGVIAAVLESLSASAD